MRLLTVVLTIGLAGACSGGSTSTPARRYESVANIGNDGLEHDFDGLEGPDHDNLAAARADLRSAAAVERRFDRSLLAIPFAPAEARTARALVAANEARARLTAAAATAATLGQLRADEQMLTAANGPVEREVKELRRRLGLRPPSTS